MKRVKRDGREEGAKERKESRETKEGGRKAEIMRDKDEIRRIEI